MDSVDRKYDQVQTNESKVRLVAFFVFLLGVTYYLTNSVWILLFLIIDFGLRAFDLAAFSPLAFFSDIQVKAFRLPVKPVYLPPKRFAARIGLLFCIAILLLHLFQVNTIIINAVLILFAALESFAGFCAGCYVYNFLQRFKRSTA